MTTEEISSYLDECEYPKENKEERGKAEYIKTQVGSFLAVSPLHIRRIIKYKYFVHMIWEETAKLLNEKLGESVRRELYRYIKNLKCMLRLVRS